MAESESRLRAQIAIQLIELSPAGNAALAAILCSGLGYHI